jgi:hypothetical protein
MKKVPIGRSIACVFAVVLIITGAFFLFEAHRIRQEFYQRSETRLLDLNVDFSKPGQFTAPFRQTWRACHVQTINLHIPANILAEVSPSNLLASLDFEWQITDSEGNVVVDNKSSGHPVWQGRTDGGEIPLVDFPPFDRGDYTFKCTVATGTPHLAGIDQRLVWYYQPCDMAMVLAGFTDVIGISALVIAGIILLVVRAITKRKQRDITQSGRGGAFGSPPPTPPGMRVRTGRFRRSRPAVQQGRNEDQSIVASGPSESVPSGDGQTRRTHRWTFGPCRRLPCWP